MNKPIRKFSTILFLFFLPEDEFSATEKKKKEISFWVLFSKNIVLVLYGTEVAKALPPGGIRSHLLAHKRTGLILP